MLERNINPDDKLKELSLYSPGEIEHQVQPEGGRDLSLYEQHLLFNRQELEGKTVLDLGAGPEAKFAKQLKESGIKADVVSLSPDFTKERYRKKVKESFPEGKFVAATGQALPFADESFDRIFAFHLVEHISQKMFLRCILEIARVLKKGGKATLGTMPDVDDPDSIALGNSKETMEKLKIYGVKVIQESIPKKKLLIKSMKVYHDEDDHYGQRIYNVTCHNIVLIKNDNK
ncbi:MAG: Methyltransferase type 11 [Parcubacteria group bacterium GW2011_GWA2_33_14]|uniref:Methyltransferase type 11 domain-containing protein n=1 Tax=Candidatus Staskawiczbacteria bacterium RIFCSPHIGHO2_02_FULL_33_16 TaxID=1802204 RepID=A0A1G2HXV7_9BACT|nr:MAG: Methyltransferase type 11 [Parcubacteria group bacterium GW2011_GWA2_33_14]OGZ67021.1 MAG: hypothetical protein A3D34_01345 [Candidatus Staskawiczbacteria bacterium RIFCSPHIGHO2_02_FULL_33_16]OGZ71075.1 MAG: hypothetical protein A2980_03465 [Candidatus Staskawiczbacteria bacterium RIFCSPLOWO2_01_FULL_33_13]